MYSLGVASIRAGLLKKESKGWSSEVSSPACKPKSCALIFYSCRHQPEGGRNSDPRSERNRLCVEVRRAPLIFFLAYGTVNNDVFSLPIQDPFENDYNVARTVTKDGLYLVSSCGWPPQAIYLIYPTRFEESL